jgi:tetratricopeptide (TPR) repeat protein
VWRGRLESCRLKTLERDILDVWREQDDVDGSEIPYLYIDYIRSGDASEMPRVMYHNAVDVLSMVSLSTRLMTLFATSPRGDSGAVDGTLAAGDWLALGRWHDDSGRLAEAEAALRACLAARPDPATQAHALHRLGYLLKRTERRAEALGAWESLSASQTWEGAEACVELAKHYEWREVAPTRARTWTRRAIRSARKLPAGYARDRLNADLAHRLDRLNQKRA